MGAVGTSSKAETYYDFKDNPILSEANFGDGPKAQDWWREHEEFSNAKDWEDNLLTTDEANAIEAWVGAGYGDMAELYYTQWDNMEDWEKQMATNMYNAINKFELKKGIRVNRGTDFDIFGGSYGMTADDVKKYLETNTDHGLIQNDGFLSFSTRKNGVPVAGSGLVIHLDVPPNKGGGAYISNSIGGNRNEKEYLLNNNSIMQFDSKSVRTDDNGKVHVNAKLVGRAEMQTIYKKNNSKFKKEAKW